MADEIVLFRFDSKNCTS